MPDIYEVKSERFHLTDKRIYILQGLWPIEGEIEAYLDDLRLDAQIEELLEISAMDRYKDKNRTDAIRVTILVQLPQNIVEFHKLKIFSIVENKKILWFTESVKKLVEKQTSPDFFVEEKKWDKEARNLQIRGWAVDKEPLQLEIYDEKKRKLEIPIVWNQRPDVAALYKEESINHKCGFFINIESVSQNIIYLVFKAGNRDAVYKIQLGFLPQIGEKLGHYAVKGMKYFHAHGVTALAEKAAETVFDRKKRPVKYDKWLPKHLPSKKELQKQRDTRFSFRPKFSIVVPLYKTPKLYLEQMIESVQAQTYTNWELCLSDGSGAESPIRDLLEKMAGADNRIRIVSHDVQLQISENTNAAIEISTGDYIVFMDHDDVLCPNALFECAQTLNRDPDMEIIYSDEDKMTMDGNKFFQPHFKPSFNIDLLYSVNYICHLFVVKRSLQKEVGLLQKEFDGAQDYDFILRCIEHSKKIYHIPKILYHWRSHEDSTAENPESKGYAFVAGQRAIQAHYDRMGIDAVVCQGEYQGLYKSKYAISGEPLISIIIPNKDHIQDLKRCMESIEQKSTYRNYEYIIVENNSTNEETFEYYKEIESTMSNVRVVYWKGIFNYSAINNFGATYARGDYYLLLNNDTEIINQDCLEELLGYCMREDVGVVGARLYYEDNTIQHAGVVIGFGGIAGHCFVQQPRSASGYCHRIICAQNYSAVTAACMMVKKTVFEEVGGLSTELQVAFNDIDFCLKVREAGYLIVYNPYAELYHYESKSRGLEDTPEKVERFNNEIKTMENRWPLVFKDGDPYYNPNLSLETQDFSIKHLD